MSNSEMLQERINRAYVLYDSDPRVSGPDDKDAFVDALTEVFSVDTIILASSVTHSNVIFHCLCGRTRHDPMCPVHYGGVTPVKEEA